MPELSERLQPQFEANGTRILRGPHMTALLEDWLAGRRIVEAEQEQHSGQNESTRRAA